VIRNPHTDLDHHQKLITSSRSFLIHACQVWSTSVSTFVSYPVYIMTDRQNDPLTSALLEEEVIINMKQNATKATLLHCSHINCVRKTVFHAVNVKQQCYHLNLAHCNIDSNSSNRCIQHSNQIDPYVPHF